MGERTLDASRTALTIFPDNCAALRHLREPLPPLTYRIRGAKLPTDLSYIKPLTFLAKPEAGEGIETIDPQPWQGCVPFEDPVSEANFLP